jgi:GAG-pre-integrase domain
LRRDGETLAYARREGRNYVLRPTYGTYEVRSTFTDSYGQERLEPDSYELWHQRMGHAGEEKMRLLYKAVEGVPDLAQKPEGTCETCALIKSVQRISRDAPEPQTKRLGRVYSDFWGPFNKPTLSGARYMLTFTDDHTRKVWIYLTQARTELYERFDEWQKKVERQSGEQLQTIRCDNAGEYEALA